MIKKSGLIIILAIIMIAGCGGGGGNDLASDADRFIGDWNGTLVNAGRDDGQPLGPDIALKMHMEYAGKEDVGGVMVYYITASYYADGALFLTGTIEALPGGTLIIDISQSDLKLKMLGQFTGDTASGTYEASKLNPDPPYNWQKVWATWTASR